MIAEYFSKFDYVIDNIDFIIVSTIQKRKINDFLGIIEGKLTFEWGILDILEVVKVTNNQLVKMKYKYHFRLHDNTFVFRYDNAPHHQEITTYPHHKHLPDKNIASFEPDIFQILSEIKLMF